MADNRPIGVFDSGLGGLSAIKELIRVLPDESIVYFGDTGRVPYGGRSAETIIKYAEQDENFLLSNNVKIIIAACGTVSSVAYSTGTNLPVPFIEVVTPASEAAVNATKNGKIGIIGTAATIRSDSYSKKIRMINSDVEIYSAPCPLFVPLVEAGWIGCNDTVTTETAKRYLLPLKEKGIDTLVLGCTHYPAIKNIISDIMGDRVTLINVGEQAVKKAVSLLTDSDMLSDKKNGSRKFFVSDHSESFSEIASILLGSDISDSVAHIDINLYGRRADVK